MELRISRLPPEVTTVDEAPLVPQDEARKVLFRDGCHIGAIAANTFCRMS